MRVINGKPVRLAELREAIGVIRGLANGEQVEYKGATLRLPWSPRQPAAESGSPPTARRRSR